MGKVGFFEESEGVKSSTRLNSFLMLFFFMAFNILWVQDNDITGNFLILDLIILVAVFVPKYLHKAVEAGMRMKGLPLKDKPAKTE